MADRIGVDIQFSPDLDVSALNAMIKQIKKSLGPLGKDIQLLDGSKLKKEMQSASAATKKTADSFTGLNQGIDRASKKGSALNKAFKFSVIQQGVTSLTQSLQPLIDEYVELDKQVKNIGTLGREDFQEFADISLQLAADIPGNAADMANGVYQAISAGAKGTAQEIAGFVEIAAKAGVAGLSDTTTAVNGLTSVLNAYGKEYSEANQVADTFFAGIKLGKTSFEELNSSLAAFIPSASAMGVGFDQATAAISRLTAVGTPTAQAATQMNAVFTLLAKGTAPLKKALATTGQTLGDLREKLKQPVEQGGGLVNVMRDIKVAADASGQQLASLTGRVEAAKIIESLAGSTEKATESLKTFDGVTAEIAGGASSKAFDIAATSIAAQADGFAATIQNAFSSVLQTVGPQATAAISTLNQFGPALSGVAGVAGTFGDTFKSVGSSLISFGKSPIQSVKGGITGVATLLPKAGAAFRVFWTAATGPVGLAIAGIAAVTAGVIALVDWLDYSAEERLEDAKAEQEVAKQRTKLAEEEKANQEKRVKAGQDLIDQYQKLGSQSNRTAEEEKRFLQIQNELTKAYPGAVKGTNDFQKNLANLKTELQEDKQELKEFNEEVRKAKEQEAAANTQVAQAQVGVDAESLEDELNDGLNDFFDTGLEIRENRNITQGLVSSIQNAQNDTELLKAKGELLEFVTTSDDLTQEEKTAVLERANALVAQQKKAIEAEQAEIEQAYANQLDRINEQFQNNGPEFSVSDEQIKQIAESSNKSIEEVTKAVEGMEKEARQARVGELLKESASIQGDLKQATRIDDLVKAFDEAETAAQKSAIGEQIQKIAPEMIKSSKVIRDENGDIVNAFELQANKIDEVKKKNEERFGSALLAKQKEFVTAISEEGQEYQKNEARIKELTQEVNKKRALGLDASEAENELNKLAGTNKDLLNEIVQSTVKLAQQGEVSNEVYADLGSQIGISGEDMKSLVEEAGNLTDELGEAELTAAELGESFKKTLDDAKQRQSEGVSALAELRRQLNAGEIDRQEFERRSAEIKGDTVSAIKEVKDLEQTELNIKKQLGLVEDKNAKSLFDILNDRASKQTELLEKEQEEFEIAKETEILQQKRKKDTFDEIALEQKKNETLQAQRERLREIFKVTENEDGSLNVGVAIKSKEKDKVIKDIEKLNTDLAKSDNNLLKLENEVDLSQEEIQAKLKEFEEKRLRDALEFAVTLDEKDLAAGNLTKFLQEDADKAKVEIDKLQARINELTENKTGLTDKEQTELDELKIKLNEQTEIYKDNNEEVQKINNEGVRARVEALKSEFDERQEVIKEKLDAEAEARKSFIGVTADATSKSLDKELESLKENIKEESQIRQDQIGDIEAAEEIKAKIKEEYRQKELEAEEEFRKKQEALQNIKAGQEIAVQREKDIAVLESKKTSLEEQLKLLEASDNPDNKTLKQIKETEEELSGVTDTLNEKSDTLKLAKTKLAEGLGTAFSSTFQGNSEAFKNPLRESLQVTAGFLKEQLNATVTKLILDQLAISNTGLAGLLLIPVIKGLISSALSSITDPIISSLTSFHTGGRVDEPTIAMVGDASKARPGANTEWIFRDDQIQVMLNLTASKFAAAIGGRLQNNDNRTVNSAMLRFTDAMISQASMQTKYLKMLTSYRGDSAVQGQLAKQNYKVKSYATGSGPIRQPELAMIGDRGTIPERVLGDDQLQALMMKSAALANERLEKKFDLLIDTIGGLELTADTDSLRVAVNTLNNKQRQRNRG